MPCKKKIFTLLLFMSLFSIIFVMNGKVEATNGSTSPSYMGNYTGDAAILYFMEFWGGDSLNNDSIYNSTYPFNANNTQGYEFLANSFEVSAYQFHNGTGVKVIADNSSAQTNISNGIKIAQEFSFNYTYYVSRFRLYLNYSLNGRYILRATITEADLSSSIDIAEYWVYTQTFSGLRYFYFYDNLLEPLKKYYLVFEIENITGPIATPTGNLQGNHSWKAELYKSPSDNKGETLLYNGSSWNPIQNDSLRDMLCDFSYSKVIDPREVDLRVYIDNKSCPYQTRKAPWGGGYEIYYKNYFATTPVQPINLTILMNTTIEYMYLEPYLRYIYTIPVFGWYNASFNKIDWTITYPNRYVEAWAFPGTMFAFEYDWDYVEFRDPNDASMTDIYFGPISYSNISYYAIFSLFGPMPEPGNYTGRFTSPNYCHSSNLKVKTDSEYKIVSSFEHGQTISLEALIEDSNNNPISGGNASINISTPTGHLLKSWTNLTAISGFINTPDYYLDENLEEGLYTISIFWTNGVEIGFYTIQVEIQAPANWLWLYILLGCCFALAVVSIPLISYARRKLQMRNWEKHLRNLFILTKDGRSIYGYSFGIEIQDPALISSALMAITTFVSDAVKTKKTLRVIDLQDKKVILSHGVHTITALISEKDFPVIHDRIKQFREAFEDRYGKKVAIWRGDAKAFKGTDELIQEYFPGSIEERITRGVKLKLIETRELLSSATEPEVIISILKDVTQLLTRYRPIIEQYYMDDYADLIKSAEEKMREL